MRPVHGGPEIATSGIVLEGLRELEVAVAALRFVPFARSPRAQLAQVFDDAPRIIGGGLNHVQTLDPDAVPIERAALPDPEVPILVTLSGNSAFMVLTGLTIKSWVEAIGVDANKIGCSVLASLGCHRDRIGKANPSKVTATSMLSQYYGIISDYTKQRPRRTNNDGSPFPGGPGSPPDPGGESRSAA